MKDILKLTVTRIVVGFPLGVAILSAAAMLAIVAILAVTMGWVGYVAFGVLGLLAISWVFGMSAEKGEGE